MVMATDAGIIGVRDRALMLLGFAGAFRRSELAGLDLADCAFGRDGLTITLRKSKIDQEAQERKGGINYGSNPDTCPVAMCRLGLSRPASRAVPSSAPSIAMGGYGRGEWLVWTWHGL
jgi:hypothetical protein